MKKIILFILAIYCFIGISQTSQKQNAEWTVVSSSIKFKIKNAGFTINGSFEGLVAKIIFDETKLYGNSIEATIETKSVNTSNGARDEHLRKEDYFDVNKYPKITLKATLFTKEKDGSFKGFFKLTIKDKARDVLVPFTFSQNDTKGIFKGIFTINRLDYNVGETSMILSDNATVEIEVNVVKK